jgi:hypothetical protein
VGVVEAGGRMLLLAFLGWEGDRLCIAEVEPGRVEGNTVEVEPGRVEGSTVEVELAWVEGSTAVEAIEANLQGQDCTRPVVELAAEETVDTQVPRHSLNRRTNQPA